MPKKSDKTDRQRATERWEYRKKQEEMITKKIADRKAKKEAKAAEAQVEVGADGKPRPTGAPAQQARATKRPRNDEADSDDDTLMLNPDKINHNEPLPIAKKFAFRAEKFVKKDRHRAMRLHKLDIPFSEGSRYATVEPVQAPPAKRKQTYVAPSTNDGDFAL